METTRYIGWTITIRIDDTSLGWMPETDDRLASAYRYLELAALDLERQYPGAEVKAEYGPFTRSVDVDGPDNSFETSERADRLASANRYLKLAALDLERQYPGAEVKAEYGPFTRSVDVDGPDNSFETSERAEVVRRDVEYLTARVFEAGGWDIEKSA